MGELMQQFVTSFIKELDTEVVNEMMSIIISIVFAECRSC